ncbi:unnamed protein product [Didymodactylos carnosus]|uniref:Choice-of-anchor A domain-containing protein n=1 Tax=Didymodactylos carnosus TaxID=1234261 RepID=A0A814VH63_9BILA|nr:unnamed protein product [Didymodactylos carnosus]CAF1188124.1 unnamed protein product [Didymodactylos carnosus]CAF3620370.1 unnamed protein product [Didymodactylos carnosus]CAF3952385.1 unnamed protein product [Didymodactylos carnosus]
MNYYNLITLQDLNTNSDVEYLTLVCGSFTGTSSANFAIHVSQSTWNQSVATLEIAGTIASGSNVNVDAGSTTVNSGTTIVQQAVTQYVVNGNRQFQMNGGNSGASVYIDSTLTSKCQQMTTNFQSFSLQLAQQPANNFATIPTSQPGPLNLNVNASDSNGVAYFAFADGNSVLNNNLVQQIQINNLISAPLIVVNLFGSTISFAQGNMVGSWLTSINGRSRTLWNFYNCTTLTLQNNMMGAVLAPLATTTAQANIDGATAVKSLATQSELHTPPLIFPNCTIVPTTTAAHICSPPAGSTYMNYYNLITLQSLNTNSDVEYLTLVCGTFSGTSSANFAIHVDQNTWNQSISTLEIAGAIASGNNVNVDAGSCTVNTNNTIVQQAVTQYIINSNRQFQMNGGNGGARVYIDSTLVSKCQTVTSALQAFSLQLGQTTPNNNGTIPSSQPGPLNLNVNTMDSNGIAYFTFADGNSVLNNNLVQQIQITNIVNASLIVINLFGSTISFAQGNMVGSWLTSLYGRSRTLWNFYNCTTLTLQNNMMGAVLAPLAVTTAQANIDGAAAVKSLATQSELHTPPLIYPC